MIKIQITSLQSPEILINDIPVFFPYKKAEALFYYVLFEKSINRNDAVNLLWEENSDEVGKKNLRHALYVIKKSFGVDVLISPQKSTITLNPNIKFIWDVDLFLTENELSVYKGSLLQGFNVKNAYLYEDWLDEKRKSLKELYLNKLYNNILNLPYTKLSEIECNFENYILEDPFDERIYIFMMQAFRSNKLYLKAIKLYEKLRECLSKELCITPNNEITDLYRSILKEWSEYSSDIEENPAPFLVGRDANLSFMRQAYKNFIIGNSSSILISGEAGIGKSYLIKCFLETTNISEVLLLNTSCFRIEKDSPLQAWDSLMVQLDEYISNEQINIPLVYLQAVSHLFPTFGGIPPSIASKSKDILNTFNYRTAKNGLLRIFSIISKHIPILLIIDDIHWMDNMSLGLLSMIIHNSNNKIMLICSSLNSMNNNLLSFTSQMSKNNLMSKITLTSLSYSDVSKFVTKFLEKDSITTDTIDLIFSQTEGNPFFLVELLNTFRKHGISTSFSSKTQDILNGRLTDLSQNSRQLIDIISLFDDFTTISILQKILDKTELEILDLIDTLKANSLITEITYHNTVCFKISHNMMRQYIYQCQSKYKLRILHNKVGTVLEEIGTDTSVKWYNKLIYHFSLGENHFKTLYYKVNSLDEYSSLNYELYPILRTDIEDKIMPTNNIMDYFEHLDVEFNNLRKQLSNDESFMQLEAQYLNSKVRYCILEGFYDDGILIVNKLLATNFVQKNPKYLLGAMKQMIYYGIQIYDIDLMAKYIKKGIEILQSYGDNIESAIYMRLNGLLSLMRGDYEISTSLLLKSIDIFKNSITDIGLYVINIAACYNYLGEVYRHSLDFKTALSYYKKAISLCELNNSPSNATFYTNAGRASLAYGMLEESTAYFLEAVSIYESSNTLMGRSVANGYCAIIYARKRDFKNASLYLKKADADANRLGSPYEKGLLRRTQAELCYSFKSELKDMLPESLDWYCNECLNLLKPIPGSYEINDVLQYKNFIENMDNSLQ